MFIPLCKQDAYAKYLADSFSKELGLHEIIAVCCENFSQSFRAGHQDSLSVEKMSMYVSNASLEEECCSDRPYRYLMSPSFGIVLAQRRIGTPDGSALIAAHCPLKNELPCCSQYLCCQ